VVWLQDIGSIVNASDNVCEAAWPNGEQAIIFDVAQQP
jgi:multidrug efflux pump subunit AcrB